MWINLSFKFTIEYGCSNAQAEQILLRSAYKDILEKKKNICFFESAKKHVIEVKNDQRQCEQKTHNEKNRHQMRRHILIQSNAIHCAIEHKTQYSFKQSRICVW